MSNFIFFIKLSNLRLTFHTFSIGRIIVSVENFCDNEGIYLYDEFPEEISQDVDYLLTNLHIQWLVNLQLMSCSQKINFVNFFLSHILTGKS